MVWYGDTNHLGCNTSSIAGLQPLQPSPETSIDMGFELGREKVLQLENDDQS